MGWYVLTLTGRDYTVLQEIGRWRWLLSRHVKGIADFPSQRTTDRRLHALIEAGYVDKKKILYGIPSLYLLTHKGRILIGYSKKPDKIRIEQIPHDILVLDTLLYVKPLFNLSMNDIKSEKELHRLDGFGNRKHYPDFIFQYGDKKIAVEIEISSKAKERLRKNVETNYLNYDYQFWIIKKGNQALVDTLQKFNDHYPNIKIEFDTKIRGH